MNSDYVESLERIAEIIREETRTTSDGTIYNSTDVAKAILTRIPGLRASAAPVGMNRTPLAFHDKTALDAAHEIEAMPSDLHEAQKTARIQLIVLKAIIAALPSDSGKAAPVTRNAAWEAKIVADDLIGIQEDLEDDATRNTLGMAAHYLRQFAALAPATEGGGREAVGIGRWLSAALDDPQVCEEMKTDIHAWFDAGEPAHSTAAAVLEYIEMALSRLRAAMMGNEPCQPCIDLAASYLQEASAILSPSPSVGTPAPPSADRNTARNWIEDASHENGNYECACVECGHSFIGHKRRVLCKLCSNLLTPSAQEKTP